MAAARIRIVARLGRRRGTLPPYLMGSVVAHAAFAAALILFPGLRSRKTLVPDALVVSLVEAPRPAGGPIAAPAPPPPADAPALETARLEPREPPPPKPLPENPRPKTKKEPKPTPEKAAPTRTAPAGASGPAEAEPGSASGAAGPPQPGAASVAMAGGVDSAFAWYRDSVVGAILTQWRRPVLDGLSEPLDVLIAVEILPDGDVRNLRVDQSSGVPALDRSALRAVADAVPLPPLPMHWPEATWNVAIIFRQHPE